MTKKNMMQRLLGSYYPLIQAPMAGAQDSAMTLAVCRAGALGSLPAALLSDEDLEKSLRQLTHAGVSTFNINFFCHSITTFTQSARQRWYRLLAPYFDTYAIDPSYISEGQLRQPFTQKQLAILLRYRPKVVSFHFGLPEASLVQALKNADICILSSATTVEEALWLESHGVDAIIAQGSEAGGHRAMFLHNDIETQTGLFSLLPQIVKQVRVPVIAAGGINDAQTIKAALALGAQAVQIGSAYLLCQESLIHPLHRQALIQCQGGEKTAITNLFTGRPARGLVNRLMQEQGFIHPDSAPFPFAASAIDALRHKAQAEEKIDFTPLWCGQNTSGFSQTSAQELTEQLTLAFSTK